MKTGQRRKRTNKYTRRISPGLFFQFGNHRNDRMYKFRIDFRRKIFRLMVEKQLTRLAMKETHRQEEKEKEREKEKENEKERSV